VDNNGAVGRLQRSRQESEKKDSQQGSLEEPIDYSALLAGFHFFRLHWERSRDADRVRLDSCFGVAGRSGFDYFSEWGDYGAARLTFTRDHGRCRSPTGGFRFGIRRGFRYDDSDAYDSRNTAANRFFI
jgi:hypothetical protein